MHSLGCNGVAQCVRLNVVGKGFSEVAFWGRSRSKCSSQCVSRLWGGCGCVGMAQHRPRMQYELVLLSIKLDRILPSGGIFLLEGTSTLCGSRLSVHRFEEKRTTVQALSPPCRPFKHVHEPWVIFLDAH
jgi:hypothetical protein